MNPRVHKTPKEKPDVHKTPPDVHKTPPVCKYLWKRMLCRKLDCQLLHPDLCTDRSCIPNRRPDCDRFHGRYRAEAVDGNGTDGAVAKKKPKKQDQGNGRRGVPPPHPRSKGRSNNSNNTPSSARHGKGKWSSGNSNKSRNRASMDLDRSKRELENLKRSKLNPTPLSYMTCATPAMSGNAARPSGPAPHLGSFATALATALEAALSTSGLRMAYA